MAAPVQLHAEGSSCDSLSTLCVPIVFVPGVMGSRLETTSGRTWDSDDPMAMGLWVSATNTSRQKTRRALRGGGASGTAPPTPGKVMTAFPGWIGRGANSATGSKNAPESILASDRCRAIGADATGSQSDDDIVGYYATTRGWAGVSWGFQRRLPGNERPSVQRKDVLLGAVMEESRPEVEGPDAPPRSACLFGATPRDRRRESITSPPRCRQCCFSRTTCNSGR